MAYQGRLQFSGGYDNDTDPDYVYYNASIINTRTDVENNLANFTADPAIRFLETRDVPIIKDASKYNFSIIRFTMNGPNKDLPLFIPVIRTGTANPPPGPPGPTNVPDVNLTIYSITLTLTLTGAGAGTYESLQPIIYVPETQNTSIAPVPQPPANVNLSRQDVSTRYYWVYNYSHWLTCVNKAFEDAVADIQGQVTTAGGPILLTEPPKMTYNPQNNLFSIYADRQGFGGTDKLSTTESWELWFNNNMFGLFSNFQNIYYNTPSSEKDNLIYTGVVGPYQNIVTVPTGTPTPTTAKQYWLMTQDYESTSTLWCPIESVVFNSTLLPLVFEQTGDPVIFGESNDNTESVNSRPAFQPIITDIALPIENAHAYRQLIYYAPSAEYRLASFQRSRQTINQIDIQVYWKNRLDGQLYPVQMFNCSSVSVKIMFRRRGIYDYPHPAKDGIDT
jgi:hypothetical protein